MKRFKLLDFLKGKISEQNYNKWLYREVNRIYENLKKFGCEEFISREKLLEIAQQTVERVKGKIWVGCTPTASEAVEPVWDKVFTEQEENFPNIPVLVLNQDLEFLRRICSEKTKDGLLYTTDEIIFSSGFLLTLRMRDAVPIPKTWLKRRLTIKEIREFDLVELVEKLDGKIREGYEIWEFESLPDTWKNLCGCAGICLLKDRVIEWVYVTKVN